MLRRGGFFTNYDHRLAGALPALRFTGLGQSLAPSFTAGRHLQKENEKLEATLKEARDEAKKLLAEVNRLTQQLRKRDRK
jgi:HPt (histidine-containing phosphotransfer) domain-containing protein